MVIIALGLRMSCGRVFSCMEGVLARVYLSMFRFSHAGWQKSTALINKHSCNPSIPTNPFRNVQIQEGDTTEDSALGLTVPNGENASIILPDTNLLSSVATPRILQRSSSPSLAANLTLAGVPGGEDGGTGLGSDGGSVTVDTTRPKVDAERGVEVGGYGNGTYTHGDTVFVTVW